MTRTGIRHAQAYSLRKLGLIRMAGMLEDWATRKFSFDELDNDRPGIDD